MSFLPNNDADAIATEVTVDVTMTTPDTTASTTPAAMDKASTTEIVPDVIPLAPTTTTDAKAAATRQKIIEIIDHQFDLEILLRHAEGTAIAKELAKAESMLEDLRHAILSGNALNRTRTTAADRVPGGRRRIMDEMHGNLKLCMLYEQTDSLSGWVVQDATDMTLEAFKASSIICVCHTSWSLKTRKKACGTVELWFDMNLGQPDFPKPTIKTYDEDVDLESDDGGARNGGRMASSQAPRKHSNGSVNSSSNGGTESESDTSGMVSGGESGVGAGKRRRSSLALSIVRPQKGTPRPKPNQDSESEGSDDNDESGNESHRPPHAGKGPMRKYGSMSQGPPSTIPSTSTSHLGMPSRLSTAASYSMPDSRMSSAPSSRAVSPTIHPLMSENDISEPSTPVSGFPARSIPIPSHSTTTTPTTFEAVAGVEQRTHVSQQPQQPQQLQPTIISFGASAIQAGVPAPLDTVGSRFYVKRRIVVGNVSKYLPEDKRDPRLKEFPYKWMIYVDGAPKPEDITAYISKVEFHLHESYKPNHIVTVSEAPFHLSRYAWGETQIKLDPTHCGRQVHGGERHVDLELDRNTTFMTTTPLQSRSKSSGNKSGSRNNLILNSAAEVAMADGAEEDEQELQKTLSKPSVSSDNARGVNTGAEVQTGVSAAIDTVRAASIDEGSMKSRKAKETTLSYRKACGSLWKQHRDGALGVAGTMSEPVLLNEDSGQRIPNCPHHSKFFAVKDISEDDQMLLSLLVGRSKNKFALDMLKNCGIVDQQGRPISSHDRMLLDLPQSDSAMDLDIGDSELPTPPPNPTGALSLEHRTKVQQLTDAFQKMEVYKCRRSEIDWVLSVMDELKLKTLLLDGGMGGGSGGSRYGLRDRDQEQEQLLNASDSQNVPESMSQRAVVGGLLVQATKAFLGSVLSKAISIHRAEMEAEKGPESIMMELDALNESDEERDNGDSDRPEAKATKLSNKLLAPYHVYQALQSNPEELDFLTSQYEDMEGIGEMMVGL
ncbi:YEATS domain-containing protein 2 [Dissophora ornata]|nr:YEATS domain-containing protein 2 [Dissophora ornata]